VSFSNTPKNNTVTLDDRVSGVSASLELSDAEVYRLARILSDAASYAEDDGRGESGDSALLWRIQKGLEQSPAWVRGADADTRRVIESANSRKKQGANK